MPVKITGIKKVDTMLTALGSEAAVKVSKAALKVAAVPVRRAAERIIPLGSGRSVKSKKTYHLRNNIVIRMSGGKKKARVNVTQRGGAFQGETFYGSFVELGHRTGKRTGEVIRAKRLKVEVHDIRREVAGRWYMKQAGDEGEQQAIDIYRRELANWVTREAK